MNRCDGRLALLAPCAACWPAAATATSSKCAQWMAQAKDQTAAGVDAAAASRRRSSPYAYTAEER